MIPPVEERQWRDCKTCIGYKYLNGEWPDGCGIFDTEICNCRGSGDACKYHLTQSEYQELIDSGRV